MINVTGDSISFKRSLSDKGIYNSKGNGAVDHKEIAKFLLDRSLECVSVIILCSHLRREHLSSPDYVKSDYSVGYSQLHHKIRQELQGSYPTMEEIKKLIRKKKYPVRSSNWDRSEIGRKNDAVYSLALENAIYAAYEYSLFPMHIVKARFEFEASVVALTPGVTKDELKLMWRSELVRLLLPVIETKSERLFKMPKPFDSWDSRNKWQQFFFADRGDSIYYAIGGDGSSSRRENHGRYAHAFAELAVKYNIEAPTYVFEYTCDNTLKLVKKYEGFKVINQDLSGGYKADLMKTKNLFKYRMLSLESSGALVDIR